MDKPLLPQNDKGICHALFFAQDSRKSKNNTVSQSKFQLYYLYSTVFLYFISFQFISPPFQVKHNNFILKLITKEKDKEKSLMWWVNNYN